MPYVIPFVPLAIAAAALTVEWRRVSRWYDEQCWREDERRASARLRMSETVDCSFSDAYYAAVEEAQLMSSFACAVEEIRGLPEVGPERWAA